jgi:hypothetical protein
MDAGGHQIDRRQAEGDSMSTTQNDSRQLRTLTRANATDRLAVEHFQQAPNVGNSNADDTTAPAFSQYHPVLRPMRATCERMFEAGDYSRAFPVLHALAMLNGRRSFWHPAVHEHFADDEKGQGDNARN